MQAQAILFLPPLPEWTPNRGRPVPMTGLFLLLLKTPPLLFGSSLAPMLVALARTVRIDRIC